MQQTREPLTIAVAQPLCIPYNVAANALTHAAAVRAAGARVVHCTAEHRPGCKRSGASRAGATRTQRPCSEQQPGWRK